MIASELTQALEKHVDNCSDWRVSVISRGQTDQSNLMEDPVFEVSVYPDDNKVHLLTNDEESGNQRPVEESLSVKDLLSCLKQLAPEQSEYTVFYGAHLKIDDDWSALENLPLVGVMGNPELKIFGLLQGPLEQWNIPSQ